MLSYFLEYDSVCAYASGRVWRHFAHVCLLLRRLLQQVGSIVTYSMDEVR